MGFLFATGLVAAGAVAWPIYLHIFRRRRVIQVVPSLRLFGLARRQSRQANLEQLLLLIARCLIVAALAVLLGQPYVESGRDLPLPLAAGEVPASVELAVVVDDSLSAVAGSGEANRLHRARAWLRRQIEALPPTARVRLTPTSAPTPTAPLNPEEALELLAGMEPVPYVGDATEALASLIPRLGGDQTCVAILAPRLTELWPDRPLGQGESPLPVQFLDTTEWGNGLVVEGVERSGESVPGASWECRLSGPSEVLGGQRLTIAAGAQELKTVTVSPHAALRGHLLFDLPEDRGHPAYVIRAGEAAGHPWHAWYFRASATGAGGPRGVLVVRQPDEAGLLADRILTAILLATRPELAIAHQAPDDVHDLPGSGAVILVGDVAVPGIEEWLTARGTPARRVLCVPTATGAAPRDGVAPAYAPAVDVEPAAVNPLRLGTETAFWPAGLEELLLGGRSDITPSRLVAPRTDGTFMPVLLTVSGQALLAGRPYPGGNVAWALGIPLDLDAGNAVFHPLFPLIIAETLFPSGAGQAGPIGGATVGQPVDLLQWFDLDGVDGTLLYPDGDRLPVRGMAGRPLFVNLSTPGVYELQMGDRTRHRVANYPRLPGNTLVPREDWAARRPELAVTWRGPDEDLPPAAYGATGRRPGQRDALRYDLTPVAVGLLGLWLFLEVGALLLVWRRREA